MRNFVLNVQTFWPRKIFLSIGIHEKKNEKKTKTKKNQNCQSSKNTSELSYFENYNTIRKS